jgi:hypothetical protein
MLSGDRTGSNCPADREIPDLALPGDLPIIVPQPSHRKTAFALPDGEPDALVRRSPTRL